MEKFFDIIMGSYAGTGFGQVIHWIIVVFLGIAALYIFINAVSRVLDFAGTAAKQDDPAVKSAAQAAVHEEAAKSAEGGMNEAAGVIGLAFHLQMLKNSVKHITVNRVYKPSWKEGKRAGAMERL